MPIRGETIGAAYVRILADGTGFEADAERQLREAEPTFTKVGERHNDAYNRGWNSGLPGDDEDPLESFTDALEQGRGRYNRIGALLAGDLEEGFADTVNRLFPDVGNKILQNLRADLASGSIGEVELINRLHNLRAEAAKAYRGIADDNAILFNELEASTKRYAQGLDNTGRSRRQFLRDIRAMVAALPDAVTNLDSFRATVTLMRREVVNATPRLTRFREEIDKTGTTLGRVFGKGSRNNFLNFFGSFIQGMSRLTRVFTTFYRWPGLIAEQVGRMVTRFQALVDEAGSLRGAFLNLASQGLPGLIAAVGAAVGLLTTLGVSLGPAAAALVGLTGIVLSLAGSLGFALVGGAVAAAGSLFPLAVAIGVVALAIGGLDKKNKAVKQNLKELEDQFKRLQRIASEGLFGKDGGGLDNLTVLLKAVEPVVKSVSRALGDLLDDLGDVAKSKEFVKLMTNLSEILPPMVTTLGKIGGNIGLGLIRGFIVLEPYITDFLGWMEEVSKAFADFSKDDGARGGSKLAQFFDKAAGSAMRLWDLIVQVGSVIATVFSAGKSTGDNIITSLADAAEDLNKWLTSPEGQQALKDMFGFAEQLAGALGQVVVQAVKFIDALDTPTSRFMLLGMVGALESLIGWLTIGAGLLDRWNTFLLETLSAGIAAFQNMISGAAGAVQGIIDAFGQIKDYIVNVLVPDIQDVFSAMTLGDFLVEALRLFEDVFAGIQMLFNGFFEWWTTNVARLPLPMQIAVNALIWPWLWLYNALVGNSIVPDLINEIIRLFGTLPTAILFALGGPLVGLFVVWMFGVPEEAARVARLVIDAFSGLATKIIQTAGNVSQAFSTWFSGVGGIATRTADAIVRAFTGLAGRIIRAATSFSSALSGWLAPAPGIADRTSVSIANQFSGMAAASIRQAGSLAEAMSSWGNAAVREANSIADGIVDQFRGLNKRIEQAIGPVEITVKVNIPDIPQPTVTARVIVPETAGGGVFNGPQVRMIGEAGPEAVVPLNRNLAYVDPAVRALSAIAQGLPVPRNSGLSVDTGKENTEPVMQVTIITPTEDPRAVAAEVFARLTAASYV